MKAGDLLTISPLIALTLAPVVVMLAAAFWRSHALALVLTLAAWRRRSACSSSPPARPPRMVTPLRRHGHLRPLLHRPADRGHGRRRAALVELPAAPRVHPEEYYVLLLTATLGGAALVASTHFASFFLGLEILSVSLYALIVYPIYRAQFVEAAVKYLVLAGATSAFLVFGMALVYAETGTMTAAGVRRAGRRPRRPATSSSPSAWCMILVGVGFKLAVVPFHMWTPDVYQGAPAPVTAYIATVSKGAVFALLLRYLLPREPRHRPRRCSCVFAAVAVASMVAGNLLALRQDNVKRILAYSSIAHLGYLLVAFLATGERGGDGRRPSTSSPTSPHLVAFGVVTALSTGGARRRRCIADYRGLGARATAGWPAIFAVALFSLAGMPLTDGLHRQVLRRHRRRRLGAVGAGHRARADQHHRPLLLHALIVVACTWRGAAGRGRRGRGRGGDRRPARSRRPLEREPCSGRSRSSSSSSASIRRH